MASRRIYAAAGGQCLVRDTPDVDEDERQRVLRDFHAGVRLVFDPERREVRGFVPARRRSPEAFFAAVQIPDESDESPLETFSGAVSAEFDRRDHWEIRTDTPEGEAIEDGRPNAGGSGTVAAELVDRLRERSPTEPPITVGVDGFGTALGIIEDILEDGTAIQPGTGPLVVTREPEIDHLDPAVRFWTRDQRSPAEVLDVHVGESFGVKDGTDRGPVTETGFDGDSGDRGSDVLTATVVLAVAAALFAVGYVWGTDGLLIGGVAVLIAAGLLRLRPE